MSADQTVPHNDSERIGADWQALAGVNHMARVGRALAGGSYELDDVVRSLLWTDSAESVEVGTGGSCGR